MILRDKFFYSLGLLALFSLIPACSSSDEMGSDMQKVGEFKRPQQEGECGTLSASSESYNGLSLGLSMVGDDAKSLPGPVALNCRQDVVIFVHGWSTRGDPSEFAHAKLWREKGFQTFVFRWHDLSSSGNFEVQFKDYTRIASQRLAEAMRELYASLGGGNYSGEIRVVGHSLGAKVAAEAVSNISPLGGEMTGLQEKPALGAYPSHVPVSRLTLLDPAVFANWNNNEISICPMLRLSTGARDGQEIFEGQSFDPMADEADRFQGVLSLIPSTVAVEVYGANVASAFSFSLAKKYVVQTVTTGGPFGCYINFEGLNLFEVHNSVIDGYFESIAHGAPSAVKRDGSSVRLNSASVPTRQLLQTPGWYILKKGHPLSNWDEQVFVDQDIPEDHFRLTFDKGCLSPFGVDEDCQAGIGYVIRF